MLASKTRPPASRESDTLPDCSVPKLALPKGYISVQQTAAKRGVHEITIYKWAKSIQDFPKRVRISPGRVAFVEAEIDEYFANRPRVDSFVEKPKRKSRK